MSYLITGAAIAVGAITSMGPLPSIASQTASNNGKIFLQVESHGEAWYVNPSDARRYYLGNPDDAFTVMEQLGVGITNTHLKRIPTINQPWDGADEVMSSVRGKIVLQVENHGEAWYVNPHDGKRYYLGTPSDAFALMTQFGIGITDEYLQTIEPSIAITHVQAAGGVAQEYIQITNFGPFAQTMSNWFVANTTGKKLRFMDTTIAPDETITVKRRVGQRALWNNNSGTTYLYNASETLIDRFHYSTADRVELKVPFTTQAPTGNWGTPFNEACEEAIIVMLQQYYRSANMLSDTAAESAIRAMVDWELTTFGHHEDTSAAETAQTIRSYLGLAAEVSETVTTESIKQALSDGHPVVVPVYGKALNNPHYRYGGPYYHVILLIGYDGNNFIAHDPGTRYGESYYYNADTLLAAIHDLTDPETAMSTGTPRIIIVENDL